MKIAVFDIGTNSIHMLIVEVRRDFTFDVLDHEKDATRLGDGSFDSGRILPRRFDRGLQVIERFHKIALKSDVKKVVAVATSAVREAKNGGDFVEAVYKRTGIKVQVISGEEEGRLIFLAARSSVDTQGKNALVIDIGGGSVELVLGNSRELFFNTSLKLGVARLTDRFLAHDPPTKKELKRLRRYTEEELRAAVREIRRIGFSVVIGTSGTMINLASMVHAKEQGSALTFVNHYKLGQDALADLGDDLDRSDLQERLEMPGIDPKRADLIVAGGVLVRTLLRLLKVSSLTISDKAIREGIILDFIAKNEKRIKGEEDDLGIRERSILQLAKRCAYDQPHAEQVARLSLELFDATQKLHRLEPKHRELLRFAALLHDIGYHVSFNKHHKHSYYLIVNSDLDGFTSEEIEMIGAVSRYHRKRLPVRADEHYAKVGARNARAMNVLSAILRIADGLDRTHFGVVKSLRCRVGPGKFRIRASVRQDAELELWQADQRKDLFEKVFRRKVTIEVQTIKGHR